MKYPCTHEYIKNDLKELVPLMSLSILSRTFFPATTSLFLSIFACWSTLSIWNLWLKFGLGFGGVLYKLFRWQKLAFSILTISEIGYQIAKILFRYFLKPASGNELSLRVIGSIDDIFCTLSLKLKSLVKIKMSMAINLEWLFQFILFKYHSSISNFSPADSPTDPKKVIWALNILDYFFFAYLLKN